MEEIPRLVGDGGSPTAVRLRSTETWRSRPGGPLRSSGRRSALRPGKFGPEIFDEFARGVVLAGSVQGQ